MERLIDAALEDYARAHSSPLPDVLHELERYTHAQRPDAQMLSGPLEGALLRLLVMLCPARRILEIGLFTGYSALTMATALPPDGELISCEQDPEAIAIAQSFFDRTPHGRKIHIRPGPALATLEALRDETFDLVFIDADKENYPSYYDRALPLLRPAGLLIADNTLWSGRVLVPRTPADLAIAAFNRKVRNDPSVDAVLLTVRDGVTVLRKKPAHA
ncbi:MAG TPA: class I SAM-dependent methyltransferase [Acidiferrobacter sp.]|nr:class I SAM-dependent methyltransferase [Acidiferrobacter sp.]